MKVFQFAAIASMILFTSSSFAKTPRSVKLLKDAMTQNGLVRKGKAIRANQCANFSGNWQGTCSSDQSGPPTYKNTLTIEQENCFDITIDGFTHTVNGSLAITSNPGFSDDSHIPYYASIAYAWNDSQTKLKGITTMNLYNGSLAGIMTHSMWMSGDQLQTKGEYATPLIDVDGPKTYGTVLEDCTYDRVSSGQ